MADLTAACAAARELLSALHAIPEIAFQEERTSQHLAEWLTARGAKVTRGVGGTGLVARVEASRPGPARLFRADIDAIPLSPVAAAGAVGPSVPDGHRHTVTCEEDAEDTAQHGCGHDGHSSMLAGALLALAAAPEAWTGSVSGVFQPAEETGQGAQAVLAHEALADAAFDEAYAIHNQPGLPRGELGVAEGVAAVASTGLVVRVTGKATHASTPHKGNAAIAALSTLVGELLALPSYVTPFGSSVLITPTYLDCGRRQFGRVPSMGELGLVFRSNSDRCMDRVLREGDQLARHLAQAYELELETEFVEPFPVTANDPDLVQALLRTLTGAGLPAVLRPDPQPWSEDFGYFLQRWPGALMLLGAGEDHPSLHSREYAFPAELIEPGVRAWTAIAGLS